MLKPSSKRMFQTRFITCIWKAFVIINKNKTTSLISKRLSSFLPPQGVLPDGREIAVKRLFFNNKHRAADFYNEVNIISSVEHRNLVRLLGCSCSGPESLLVYEFLPNKSLDRFIFGTTSNLLRQTLKMKQLLLISLVLN